MTVALDQTRYAYSGNGATTDFAFPVPFLAAGDLDVYLFDTTTQAGTLQTLGSA